MYFKLSLKNVRRSLRDYLLYFLTLTFAVCIFYVFNSLEAQDAMLKISESSHQMLKMLTNTIGVISIFVSFILGFLIVYANNFLIRRRKKELGLYMTLGMNKSKLSRILVMETFIIGVFALGTGLVIGIGASQWLSLFTAKLFQANLDSFTFIFSSQAFIKTILYFGLIFLIVMVMSTVAISKYKLIDLLNASRKNEVPKLKNPMLTIIMFILSIAAIGTAYGMVLHNGIYNFDQKLAIEIILGIIGTFLFFASLSGFFLKLIQSNKRRYFKGLNMFILRQINSRINTAHISISLICLMLFLTIGILSTGLGLNSALNKTLKNMLGFDVSFWDHKGGDIDQIIAKSGITLNNYTDKYAEFGLYNSKTLKNKDLLESVKSYMPKDIVKSERIMSMPVSLVKESDYNKLMALKNKPQVTLSDSVALYTAYSDDMHRAFSQMLKVKDTVKLDNKEYKIYPRILNEVITEGIGVMILIVPDEVTAGNSPVATGLVFNCKGNRSDMQDKLVSDVNKIKRDNENQTVFAMTQNGLRDSAAGVTAIVSYISIYLGLIFLIASAAILALQQLSEVADNRLRYTILRKVGADDRLIYKALFDQTLIYFGMPLLLACVHAVVGIKVASDAITAVGEINILANIAATAAMILSVYGAYFLATYFGCKSMIVKNKMID